MAVVALTDREWQLLDQLKAGRSTVETARAWGTSRQNVSNLYTALIAKGVIRHPSHVEHLHWDEQYPWVFPDGVELRYRPALPPDATLRAVYPTDSTRDMSVATIRFVRWDAGGFTVQGLPPRRPDNAPPRVKVPEHRVVWVTRDDDERSWSFAARIDQDWCESWTVRELRTDRVPKQRLGMSEYDRENLTLMIAAAVGVNAVLDLNAPDHHSRAPRKNPTSLGVNPTEADLVDEGETYRG